MVKNGSTPPSDARSVPALVLEGIGLSYGAGDVLEEIDLVLPAGSFTILTGSSGAGKTSLLRLVTLSLRPSRGRLRLFGRDAAGIGPDERTALRRRLGIVLQDARLVGQLSVYDNVALPLVARGLAAASYRAEVLELLDWVGLGPRALARPDALSGGERQRVAIARAVVARPDLVVADEPTGHVDRSLARRLVHLFAELNRSGTAVLIATHDETVLDNRDAPRLTLANGRLSLSHRAQAAR